MLFLYLAIAGIGAFIAAKLRKNVKSIRPTTGL